MRIRYFLPLAILSLVPTLATGQSGTSEEFYQAIRNDDLPALRVLIETDPNIADSRGQTPLHLAAAFGSLEAMDALVTAGADVNVRSASGLTPLHLSVGDIRKVRLLLDRGADIGTKTLMGRTPLLVAASTSGASDTVEALLDEGADPNTTDNTGSTPLKAAALVDGVESVRFLLDHGVRVSAAGTSSPLMAAAGSGNVELVRALLDRGAPVNEVSAAPSNVVKNGIVQFGSVTALHVGAMNGHPEVVRVLLEAGADVNAREARGMTPLMMGVSTDHASVDAIRMLVESGSDPLLRSMAGESTIDWARKFNDPDVLAALDVAPSSPPASFESPAMRSPREAVEQSMPRLEESARRMLSDGGCLACHAQPMAHMAASLAADRGWWAGEFLEESRELIQTRWMTNDQILLQALEGGGRPTAQLYNAWALSTAGEPASWSTDVLVHYLLAKQRPTGDWRGGTGRAPIQDGSFSRTAMAIRTLSFYGTPSRRSEIDDSIRRAARWLAATPPRSTEDRTMQLLGLWWADADTELRGTRLRELMAEQRADGGWAQTPHLESDAYATGQVIYTLREFGIPATDAAIARGVDYLLATQKEDGTWYATSRAMKIQPYFESGFPYGHDQWISSSATGWAAMALSRAAPE